MGISGVIERSQEDSEFDHKTQNEMLSLKMKSSEPFFDSKVNGGESKLSSIMPQPFVATADSQMKKSMQALGNYIKEDSEEQLPDDDIDNVTTITAAVKQGDTFAPHIPVKVEKDPGPKIPGAFFEKPQTMADKVFSQLQQQEMG